MKKHKYTCDSCEQEKTCHIKNCDERCPRSCGRCLRLRKNQDNFRRRMNRK